MSSEDRETRARRRLAAYVERQATAAEEVRRLAGLVEDAGGASVLRGAWWRGAATAGAADADTPAIDENFPRVTIVVAVHGAAEQLEACLWSLVRNTTCPATLLLVDDASTDEHIDAILESAARLSGVRVLRNAVNLGFTATVNRALRACTGDVVLLNSDTAVGPRWLQNLVHAAYAEPAIGTVTPLSDNAGAFSAPQIGVSNPLPLALAVDDVARLVATDGAVERPRAPTGNGFCMYLKRAVIDSIGDFDALSFPRGYGEENDFCMRAGRAGWVHVVDGRTFVHHERGASFGEAKNELVTTARRRLDELHPDYTGRVRDFVADAALARARDAVGVALARGEREGGPRPRLLFVVHEGTGGAVATNADLMSALREEFECYCFSSDRRVLRLQRIEGDASELLEEWDVERPILLGDFSRLDYRRAFASALRRCAPELVHVRHVYKHTHDAPRMAAAHCIPMVMSFHDFYCVCPTIQLIDDQGHYCGGQCTPGYGECRTVNAGRLPILKHAFVYQWRDEVEASLAGVDAFVTTSASTRDVHLRHLQVTLTRPFEIIEHGRDLAQRRGLAVPPQPGGPVRVLVPGHLDRHKGADLLDAMLKLDGGGRLELHFLGEVPERYRHLGTCHGAYERAHLADRMREIGPAFIGVLSVWAESYSHVVTEAWAAGIPVLATDLGAQAERVRERGGGFLIPHDDPAAALAAVLRAADDREAYAEQAELAHIAGLPSVADMASRYADCYRDVLDRRRTFAAPAEARVTPLRRGVWRMTALVPARTGRDGYALRRYLHPDVRWKLRTRVESGSGELRDDTDLVLVQQGAIPADAIEQLLDAVSARELALVVECAGPPDEGDERLMAAARVLIVPGTTAGLGLDHLGRPVAVLPPLLDERLFLPGTGGRPPAGTSLEGGRAVRIALLGSSDGAPEIEFLRGVVERLSAAGPLRYELEVVGDDAPDPGRDYPAYVSRLRRLRPGWDLAVAPGPALGPSRPAELRLLEHAGLGLPSVCSASEAQGPGQPGLGGLAAADDEDAWCEALQRLAADEALRDRLRLAAWEDVTERRLLRGGARELLDVLGQAFGDYAAPSVNTMTSSRHGR